MIAIGPAKCSKATIPLTARVTCFGHTTSSRPCPIPSGVLKNKHHATFVFRSKAGIYPERQAEVAGKPGHRRCGYQPSIHSCWFTALSPTVEHRTKQLEAWLSDAIKSFRSRNEGYISRIPRIVLGVKMRDLEAKYNGDVLTCMKVLQMDKLAEGAAGVERSTKKRKWLAAQDADPERGDESFRAVKNREGDYAAILAPLYHVDGTSARISTATPRRKTPVASHLPAKPQFLRTPGIVRETHSTVQYET